MVVMKENDRSVLLAGPGEGFSREIANRFAAEGYDVGLMGRNTRKLSALASDLAAAGVRSFVAEADFTRESTIDDAVDACRAALPKWDCLIYNVKDSPRGDALSFDRDQMVASFGANVVGALSLARSAVQIWPHYPGATVLLSGGNYKDEPDPDKLALGVSKGALHSAALAMAPPLAKAGVVVKELIIAGAVEAGGPAMAAALAETYWALHSEPSSPSVMTVNMPSF
jgi:NAD(P)-dependent dehydrogenase (short-subunit alcohol dehydrogenase family)